MDLFPFKAFRLGLSFTMTHQVARFGFSIPNLGPSSTVATIAQEEALILGAMSSIQRQLVFIIVLLNFP